ncbi:hypothetical protein [Paraliobacillus ryukyuensis]|uniref:hypothetical protein n=1 Tax=Paraliobacillus ryukyuensis TaxID=200904 RepID=UPI0009A7803E|nr:hypothetical protein [Paraliobacillus ryukyuensis]
MKQCWLLLVTVMIAFFLMGCTGGSYAITVGEIDTSQNSLSGEYQSFTGNYYRSVELDNDAILSLSFDVVTNKGELSAKVIQANGETIKTINPNEQVEIDEPGKYKLMIEGKEHQGSFLLEWEIQKEKLNE